MTPRPALEADLFAQVFVLAQHLGRRADAALEAMPLAGADLVSGHAARAPLTSRQWLLLAVVVRGFPGSAPTLTEAARAYGSSRQNVKQVALQLAARGYLELRPDGVDGRITRLAPTAKVAAFDAPEAVAAQAAFLAECFAPLTDDDVAALHSLVGTCLAHLAPETTR